MENFIKVPLRHFYSMVIIIVLSCSGKSGDQDAEEDLAAQDPVQGDEAAGFDWVEDEATSDGPDMAADLDLDAVGDDETPGDAAGEAEEPMGEPAPDFALLDQNPGSPTGGQERTLSETRGKVMILYFVSFV